MNNPYLYLILFELVMIVIIIVVSYITKKSDKKNVDKVINFLEKLKSKGDNKDGNERN